MALTGNYYISESEHRLNWKVVKCGIENRTALVEVNKILKFWIEPPPAINEGAWCTDMPDKLPENHKDHFWEAKL